MEQQLTLNQTVKEAIVTALIRLMNQKPYAEISVTEIARVAGVSRVSFYRNFKDKEQVLTQHINFIYRRFFEVEEIPRTIRHPSEEYAFCLPRFRFIRRNREFFTALRRNNLLGFAFEQLEADLLNSINGLTEPVDPYYMAGIVGSCVGIISLWIDRDFGECEEEIVRKYVSESGAWNTH